MHLPDTVAYPQAGRLQRYTQIAKVCVACLCVCRNFVGGQACDPAKENCQGMESMGGNKCAAVRNSLISYHCNASPYLQITHH